MNKLGRSDPNHGEIRLGIVTDELCRTIAAVGKVNDNSGSAVNDMAIGQNEAVGGDDESRSASRDVARPILAPLLNFDVHDGRRDPLGCAHYRARIFVKQRIVIRNIASVSKSRAVSRLGRLIQQGHHSWLIFLKHQEISIHRLAKDRQAVTRRQLQQLGSIRSFWSATLFLRATW